MRTVTAMLTLFALGACASSVQQRDGGLATYDALQQAQKDCAAKGMTLKLKDQGNSRYLEHWACRKD